MLNFDILGKIYIKSKINLKKNEVIHNKFKTKVNNNF